MRPRGCGVCKMHPLFIIGGVFVVAGLIAGKFTTPRPIDTRMTVGGVMVLSGVVFLLQAVKFVM